MKRSSTIADRRFSAWAIRRGLEKVQGMPDLAVPPQAEAAIAAIDTATCGENVLPSFSRSMRELQVLKWVNVFDRELAVLVASSLGFACGSADTDQGIIDPLIRMARMQARITSIRSGHRDTHLALVAAERAEREEIHDARFRLRGLDKEPADGS
jgi:hypothetical protein